MKICHVNSSVKFHSLSSCMKTEQVLLTVKRSLFSQLNWRTWPESKRKLPCGFDAAFFTTVFRVVEKLCAVFKFIFAEKKLFNLALVALTKMLRNKAKIYQETDFVSTEWHLSTSSGCFLTLTHLLHWTLYRLDLRLARFDSELPYLISKLCSFAKVE